MWFPCPSLTKHKFKPTGLGIFEFSVSPVQCISHAKTIKNAKYKFTLTRHNKYDSRQRMSRVNSIENFDYCVSLAIRRDQRNAKWELGTCRCIETAYVNRKIDVGKNKMFWRTQIRFFSYTVVKAKGNISVSDTLVVKYFASTGQFLSFQTQRNFQDTWHRFLINQRKQQSSLCTHHFDSKFCKRHI